MTVNYENAEILAHIVACETQMGGKIEDDIATGKGDIKSIQAMLAKTRSMLQATETKLNPEAKSYNFYASLFQALKTIDAVYSSYQKRLDPTLTITTPKYR